MDFSEIRVLVVDDDAFIRRLLVRFLASLGISNIQEAESGADALARLPEFAADLILLDIIMEHQDGLQFLKTVRTGIGDAAFDTKIIVVTGATHDIVQETAEKLHCDGYLTKPIEAPAFERTLKNVWAAQPRAQAGGAYASVELPA